MNHDSLHDRTRDILETAAARFGVPVHDARLLRMHGNASYALPSAGLVIRIAASREVLDPVAASIDVTRWLAGGGFPCTVPADIDEQPVVISGHVVSAWQYVPTVSAPAPSGAELGTILHRLHAQGDPPYPLPGLGDPLTLVTAEISRAPDAVPAASLSWLQQRVTSLSARWLELDFPLPSGLIHGDAHIGNLMRAASGEAILGDWDHVCAGPREWDLASIHYIDRRFGSAGTSGISDFTAAYGWDIRSWPELETLIAVRELWGLRPYIRAARDRPGYRQQLGYRLRTLMSGDTHARWELAQRLVRQPPSGP